MKEGECTHSARRVEGRSGTRALAWVEKASAEAGKCLSNLSGVSCLVPIYIYMRRSRAKAFAPGGKERERER